MSDFGDLRHRLDQLLAGLWRECEHSDAALDGLNDRLRRLAATGLLGPTVVMGPFVLSRPYAVGGPTGGGQSVQAVLALPGGFGVVYWDTEDWNAFGHDDDREAAALHVVTPYEDCEPAVRGLIGPHAPELLRALLGLVGL